MLQLGGGKCERASIKSRHSDGIRFFVKQRPLSTGPAPRGHAAPQLWTV